MTEEEVIQMSRIGVEWVNNYHGRASDLRNCDECAERFYDELDGTRNRGAYPCQ